MKQLLWSILILLTTNGIAQTEKSLNDAILDMKRIYNTTYNIEAGIKSCKTVLSLVESNTKQDFEARFYLGEWYINNRNKAEALALLKKMRTDLESITDKEVSTYWLHWHYLKARYNGEIVYHLEKALIHSVKGFTDAKQNPIMLMRFAQQTAELLGLFGQYDFGKKALQFYQLTGQFLAKDDFARCKFQLNLGKTYTVLEQFEAGEKALQKAIEIIEPKADKVPYLYDYCRYHLALNRRLNEGEPIDLLKQILNGGNRNYKYVGLLAETLAVTGQYEEGLPLVQEALQKLIIGFKPQTELEIPPQEVKVKDIRLAATLCYYKSWLLNVKGKDYIKAGKEEEGIALLRAGIAIGNYGVEVSDKKLAVELLGYEIAALTGMSRIHIIMGGVIHCAKSLYDVTQSKEDLNNLFKYMERRRCLTLHQALAENPIPEQFRKTYDAYAKKIKSYEIQLSINRDLKAFSFPDDMLKTMLDFETFIETLKTKVDKLTVHYNDIDFLGVEDIQATLDDETAFIQYSVVRRHVYAMLITKNTVQVEFLVERAENEDHIMNYINSIRNPLLIQAKKRDKFIEDSKALYDVLLLPFEQNLADKKRLIISPERELLFLPFETLLKSAEKKPFEELDFLVKKMEINYHYSATLHQKIHQRPAIQDFSMLAFAPVFSNGTATESKDQAVNMFTAERYSSMEDKQFIHLPNSKKEVEAIKNILTSKGEINLYLQEKATKENLMNQISQKPYQFIHIATHSMVNFDDPRLSAIACYQKEGQDNIYFSDDISHVPIQADLVILSSCESGVGRIIEGEGLIGLNRSFIYAGARNVLFSLWKVNDKYSSELMINFYEQYAKGDETYTSALRASKLKMLDNPVTASPRFWAPFVLMGE